MIRFLLILAMFGALPVVPDAKEKPKKVEAIPEAKVITVCWGGKCEQRLWIPMKIKHRTIVAPETIGFPKDYPFPVSKETITFECPNCGQKMFGHGVYPHLPWCSKPGCNNCPMMEVDDPAN